MKRLIVTMHLHVFHLGGTASAEGCLITKLSGIEVDPEMRNKYLSDRNKV